MCEPTTLMVLGTITSTLGTLQAGAAAAADAKFQQQVALDNANRTTEQIRDARERGADEEQQVLTQGAQAVAGTRAALASNNLDISFGSPLDTILNTSVEVDRDAARVRRNTEREVRDLEVRRSNFRNTASAQGATASNARTAGFVAGVGTALGGAADVTKFRASIV